MWWGDLQTEQVTNCAPNCTNVEIKLQLKGWHGCWQSQGCWQRQFNKTTRRHSFLQFPMTCATASVGFVTKLSRVLLYANKQWCIVGTPTSNWQHWDSWPAAVSSQTVWLWLYCVNNWLICAFYILSKEFLQKHMRQNWLLDCLNEIYLKYFWLVFQWTCLFAHTMYILKTFIKVFALKKGSCFKDFLVIFTDKQIEKKKRKKNRLRQRHLRCHAFSLRAFGI